MREIIKTPSREFWKIASEKGCGVVFGKDAHNPNQISEDKDYEIVKVLLGEEIFKKLDFMSLDEVSKKQASISIEDIEEVALSTTTTHLNQTIAEIEGMTKQKESEELSLED